MKTTVNSKERFVRQIADMEAVAADGDRERAELVAQVAELRHVAAEKMALLDEFEKRFSEQYREWEGRAAELAEEVKVRLGSG